MKKGTIMSGTQNDIQNRAVYAMKSKVDSYPRGRHLLRNLSYTCNPYHSINYNKYQIDNSVPERKV